MRKKKRGSSLGSGRYLRASSTCSAEGRVLSVGNFSSVFFRIGLYQSHTPIAIIGRKVVIARVMMSGDKLSLPPGTVHGPVSEKSSASVFQAMSPLCMLCKKQITPEDGLFFYVAQPYYGVLHKECAPFFSWNDLWPHEQPYVYYLSKHSRT